MTYNAQKKYLLYVSIAFVVGAFFYLFLAILLEGESFVPTYVSSRWGSFIEMICIGGYLISSILSGALLTITFLKKLSKKFKVLANIFIILAFVLVFFTGFFLTVPYYIYCLVGVYDKRRIDES